MRLRLPLLLPAVGVTVALVSGCSGTSSAPRSPGDPVSAREAATLAQLLHRDYEQGGADFRETVSFAEGAQLTMTGTVDFVHSTGRAQAVTTYSNGQPSENRTVFFTAKELWYGDVPGLTGALTDAGLPQASYVRRPLSVVGKDGQASLIDVLARLVLNLSSAKADDAKSFQTSGYTWQGQRSIDGHLASLYRLKGGATVALGVQGKTLLQYSAPLPGASANVTITLPAHGERSISLPTDAQTLDATAHPDVASQVGV